MPNTASRHKVSYLCNFDLFGITRIKFLLEHCELFQIHLSKHSASCAEVYHLRKAEYSKKKIEFFSASFKGNAKDIPFLSFILFLYSNSKLILLNIF